MLKARTNQVITTELAPTAIGAYSQGVAARPDGVLVFTSGQLPLDPVSGALTGAGPGQQCTRALHNALAIIEAAGGTVADVVRSTLYVVDIDAFDEINAAYAAVFGDHHRPARTVIGVSALPRGADIEVELVASLPLVPAQ
jgi:2-iminobutanoate/2-iminopropanoate deaminase